MTDARVGGRRSRAIDAFVVLALASTAAISGTAYVRGAIESGARPEYYQVEFGPAVALACGHGYANMVGVPSLSAFLTGQASRFDCRDLESAAPTNELSGPQATWKYLMWSAALTWTLSGEVSWAALVPLGGALFGAAVALTYAGLRLFAGRSLAVVGSLALMSSPLHLAELPHLRDYSKAPFMIAVGVVISLIALRRLSDRRLWIWSSTYGALLGLGTGFRNDLLITAPAFALAALIAATRGTGNRAIRALGALAVAGLSFFVTALPVLGAYREGGGASMAHVALLGLARPFDAALGVTESPLYSVTSVYSDSAMASLIGDYASRVQNDDSPLKVYGQTYDHAASAVLGHVVRTLPADLWIRGLASVLRVVEMPSSVLIDTEPPPYLHGSVMRRFYVLRSDIVRGRQTAILALVLAGAMVLVAENSVGGVALIAVLMFFCAYPAIQFHERHYFHLNVVPIAAIAFLITRAGQAATGWARAASGIAWRRAGPRVLVVMACVSAGIGLPLPALRHYQQRQVGQLLSRYESAARETLHTSEQSTADGRVLLDLRMLPARTRAAEHPVSLQSEFLSVEVQRDHCDAALVVIDLQYDSGAPAYDFSRRFAVVTPQTPGTVARILFPVYHWAEAPTSGDTPRVHGPQGLLVASGQRACIASVTRLSHPDRFPLLLEARLPEHWSETPKYQTLSGWEHSRALNDSAILVVPETATVPLSTWTAPLTLLTASQLASKAETVAMTAPGVLRVRGTGGIGGRGAFTYLALFEAGTLKQGQRLLVEGLVHRGGLAVGVLIDEHWDGQAAVTTPGLFRAVVELPRDTDRGVVVIANHTLGWSLHNDVEITRIGWLQ